MSRHYLRAIFLLLAASSAGLVAGAAGYDTTDRVVYTSPGGDALRLTLYQPKKSDDALRPAILLIHGGGWKVGTRYQCMWYGHRFAEHGYVAVTINYRMMMKYPFPNCIHDAKAAVRWLRLHAAEYRIDPDRIAAFGESAGGHLAMLLATTPGNSEFEGEENPGPSSRVQAVISVYGATDLTYYRQPGSMIELWGITPKYMGRFVGEDTRKDGKDPFVEASPITYATKDTAPTLFIHGTNDHVVPFEQSKAFYEKLQSFGVPAKLIAVKGRDHGFDHFHPMERRQLFKEMLTFLDKYMNTLTHGGV
ncbi:MAG: alpha/beta hydrolase [Candidatus Hydrogenedentes bacterium]|nr:alpha/beta hydrolase [Candidatus Hydrogenedentota bacterium]